MVATVCLGQPAFFLGTHCTDHGHAQRFGPLHRNQPNPTGGGMKQDGVTFLELVGAVEQILNRHPLQHHRRCRFKINAFRYLDCHAGRQIAHLGVRPGRSSRIGNPVTDLEILDATPDPGD